MRPPRGWIGIGGSELARRDQDDRKDCSGGGAQHRQDVLLGCWLGWLRWGGGVVLKELVPDGVDRLVRLKVQDKVRCQGAGSVLPALGQLLHLLAEFRERFDRVRLIVSLQ